MFCLINSARSKVRGTLEIYHAFIRDLDSSRGDNDWEIVDNGSTPVSIVYSIFFRPHILSVHTTLNNNVLCLAERSGEKVQKKIILSFSQNSTFFFISSQYSIHLYRALYLHYTFLI